MRYVPIAGNELDQGLIDAWDRVQSSDPLYRSPFLSPWFTRAVAEVRDDVFVTLLLDGDTPVGFFPYQRQGSRAIPVGGRLNDCQAVVAAPGAAWTPKELVRGSGLKVLEFDHILTGQTPFLPHALVQEVSPVVDVSHGAEAYFAERKAQKSGRIPQMQRKWRKLLREHGGEANVRFEARSRDTGALDQVIKWKLDQCHRIQAYPFFNEPWTVELVHRLLEQDAPGCSGALSVLRVGDEVVAAHFGMTSRAVWHWWFPTYSDAWASYSTGGLLLLALTGHVGDPAQSQQLIDLGKGDGGYKDSHANGEYTVIEGFVAPNAAYTAARKARLATLDWARQSPAMGPVRTLRHRIRHRA